MPPRSVSSVEHVGRPRGGVSAAPLGDGAVPAARPQLRSTMSNTAPTTRAVANDDGQRDDQHQPTDGPAVDRSRGRGRGAGARSASAPATAPRPPGREDRAARRDRERPRPRRRRSPQRWRRRAVTGIGPADLSVGAHEPLAWRRHDAEHAVERQGHGDEPDERRAERRAGDLTQRAVDALGVVGPEPHRGAGQRTTRRPPSSGRARPNRPGRA